jgi:hypothetical protein
MQVTILQADRVLRHKMQDYADMEGNLCFKDLVLGNESQYPRMKSYGTGLWLGSIEGHIGRLTAVAYETLHNYGWLVVVEAHVRQGEL